MISFSPTTLPPSPDRTGRSGSDSIRRSTMSLAPNLVTATNRVREAMDEYTPFLQRISIFREGIDKQISNIENSNDKYLKSQKLKFLEKHPFLKNNNDHLFAKLKLSQQKLSESLTLIYEQQLDVLPPDIHTLLNETQSALTACKDSLSAISGYESKSMSDKKFALGAVFVNFLSSAVVPCIFQILAAKALIPATIGAAAALSISTVFAAPVLTAVISAIIGVVTLTVGIRLYYYYKNRSGDPSHKLDNTQLALEELSRCLTVMDESFGISKQSIAQPIMPAIDTEHLAPILAEALSDEDIVAFRKFLTLLINNRNAILGRDQNL